MGEKMAGVSRLTPVFRPEGWADTIYREKDFFLSLKTNLAEKSKHISSLS